ncbi:ABC transporter permease [Paenibacillus sp. FSL R7-277]|uniref:ABC transporter permease n=1 Tax=Paenibacillus sp. FSL R7-277 TaxID=1227352 RepID=UPI0003E24E36|nr:ABC transporter permease [Paenibacillus sp. FSL R7-277]ETT60993.1 ABC transporter permease [Paenibacillus sp. FSL R7-277]
MKNKITVHNVSLKNLRHYKSRTLLTVGTVALAVALIFVVLTYFYSEDQRSKREAINELGAYHVQYEHLLPEQQQAIENNPKIKKHYVSYISKNVKSDTFEKLNINMAISYIEGINKGLIQLREGRAPVTDDEIVLDKWVIEELGFSPNIGVVIPLNLQVMNAGKTEHITKNFKLVGIIDDIAVRKTVRAGLMFISQNLSRQYSPNPDVVLFALLNSDFNASSTAHKIGEGSQLKVDQIQINERYNGAYEQNPLTILKATIVVFVIIISAAMVIYNIFNIYISEQIRLFGMMKAIGMTPNQLRKMILTEGLIISLVGSSMGLLLGVGGSAAFIPFLGHMASGGSELYVQLTPYIACIAFITGLILVIFSVYIPAKKVGRITEIAAIRYNPAEDLGKRSHKTKKKFKNSISGFTLVLAQLIRYRKRTWVTITSITLTGLIFVVTGSILSSININNMAGSMVPGDYKLSTAAYRGTDVNLDLLNNKVINQVDAITGVKKVLTEMYDVLIYNKQDANLHLKDMASMKNPEIRTDIYAYDDALMKNTLKRLGKDDSMLMELRNGDNLIAIAEDGSYHVGDKIRMAQYGEGKKEREFTIVGVLPNYVTYKGDSSEGGVLIAHQDLFKRLGLDQRIKQISVLVDQGQQGKVEQTLKGIANADRRITFTSFQEIYQEFNGMKKVLQLAANGLISALMIISIFNLINSNLTSMNSRKREISLIEAIGLSRSQLILQLGSEGLMVILISLLFTFSLGIPAGYFGVEIFKQSATYVQYQLPQRAMLILICAYFIVQVVTTFYMQWRLSKESLMERIRFSE